MDIRFCSVDCILDGELTWFLALFALQVTFLPSSTRVQASILVMHPSQDVKPKTSPVTIEHLKPKLYGIRRIRDFKSTNYTFAWKSMRT